MTVALGYSHIDGNVPFARKAHAVIEFDVPAPILLGQTINADAAVEPAAVEFRGLLRERTKVYLARNHVGLDLQRAAALLLHPKIDARKIAGRHGVEFKRDTYADFTHLPFGIEEIDRFKA